MKVDLLKIGLSFVAHLDNFGFPIKELAAMVAFLLF